MRASRSPGAVAAIVALFALYGLYIAATEGTTKALISRTAPDAERASAIGFYDTAVGIVSLAASLLGGLLWTAFGPWATFAFGGGCACAAAAVLLVARPRPPGRTPPPIDSVPLDVEET